ncbi:hypothetical protein AJ87_49420 [Rhizobium yanglingense]|nr:hypothetical protein AJ87_49420 [Rhizobium yanglingense]
MRFEHEILDLKEVSRPTLCRTGQCNRFQAGRQLHRRVERVRSYIVVYNDNTVATRTGKKLFCGHVDRCPDDLTVDSNGWILCNNRELSSAPKAVTSSLYIAHQKVPMVTSAHYAWTNKKRNYM